MRLGVVQVAIGTDTYPHSRARAQARTHFNPLTCKADYIITDNVSTYRVVLACTVPPMKMGSVAIVEIDWNGGKSAPLMYEGKDAQSGLLPASWGKITRRT